MTNEKAIEGSATHFVGGTAPRLARVPLPLVDRTWKLVRGVLGHAYLTMATLLEDKEGSMEMDIGEKDNQDEDGDAAPESLAVGSEIGELESQTCADKDQQQPAPASVCDKRLK